ncbi:hypothetical protein NUBL22001_50290 [Klebsiella pneumoniae]|nr:hypothetical protein NUBL22001_50290 [Klebsiella pneumoniae]VTO24633.1 Uncharacterised protein [Klebsiella variicola]
MTKLGDIEFRLSKLEKGPDKKVLAFMDNKAKAIAGIFLAQALRPVKRN